jgi:hypothetical protein
MAAAQREKEMSARVFVHPKCWAGPYHGALIASLESRGMDLTYVRLGPLGRHSRREIVHEVARTQAGPDEVTTYERMDGTRYDHRMGQSAPEPEVA